MKVKSIKVKLEPDAYLPERAHPTDAGLDLRTREKVVLWGGKSHVFDTGVHIEMPPGCYGKIESKSGLNVKQGIVSCGGVIDEGYSGSIVVKLYNHGKKEKEFPKGSKVSQLVIIPVIIEPLEFVDEIVGGDRGPRGFGSTGI